MSQNIDTTIKQVNRFNYLTQNKRIYNFVEMRFCERLKTARLRKGLTQAELADLAGISQPTVWHLESLKRDASGSEFTPRLARILGVSVDWLADEIGEMILSQQKQRDPRIEHVLKVMESLPPYAVDAGVREIDSLAELISQIPKTNGSHS